MKKTSLGALLQFILILSLAGCGFFKPSPSQVVKNFYRDIEAGKIEDATKLLSAQTSQAFGSKLQAVMAHQTSEIKDKGGIKSIDTEEHVTGDISTVKYKVIYGNNTTEDGTFNLIKENGDWKLQASMNK